jgi:TctA family transporter
MNFGTSSSPASAPARKRALWSVLGVLFSALLLWHLYSFAKGKEEIYRSFVPAAMVLMSAAELAAAKKGISYKLLLLASAILILTGVLSFVLVEGA